jgi:hypothetical protein
MPLDFSYLNQFQRPQPAVDIGEVYTKAKDAALTRKANESDFQYKRELIKDQAMQNSLKVQQQQQAAAQQAQKMKDEQELGNILNEVYSVDGQTPEQRDSAVLGHGAKRLSASGYLGLQTHYANLAKERATADKDALTTAQYRNERLANIAGMASGMSDEELAAAWPEIARQAKDIDPNAQIPTQAPDRTTLKVWGSHFSTEAQRAKALLDAQSLRKETGLADTALANGQVTTATVQDKIRQAASEADKTAHESTLNTPNANNVTSAQQMTADQAAQNAYYSSLTSDQKDYLYSKKDPGFMGFLKAKCSGKRQREAAASTRD